MYNRTIKFGGKVLRLKQQNDGMMDDKRGDDNTSKVKRS